MAPSKLAKPCDLGQTPWPQFAYFKDKRVPGWRRQPGGPAAAESLLAERFAGPCLHGAPLRVNQRCEGKPRTDVTSCSGRPLREPPQWQHPCLSEFNEIPGSGVKAERAWMLSCVGGWVPAEPAASAERAGGRAGAGGAGPVVMLLHKSYPGPFLKRLKIVCEFTWITGARCLLSARPRGGSWRIETLEKGMPCPPGRYRGLGGQGPRGPSGRSKPWHCPGVSVAGRARAKGMTISRVAAGRRYVVMTRSMSSGGR